MRIGILTFHNAHNYGAVMQAYALREKLRAMGHDSFILNYRNQAIEKSYSKRLKIKNVEWSCLSFKRIIRYLEEWKNCKYKQAAWSRQCDKFNEFIESVLLEGNTKELYLQDLEKMKIDCFICGSDQIWTSWLTGGLDKVYFLDFSTNAKRISYAASKFSAQLAENEKEYFSDRLSEFDNISVREESLADELSKECHLDVKTVFDPTLLLEKEEYLSLEKPVKENYKYVLAYYLCEDPILDECAGKAAKILRLPLIELHFYKLMDKDRYQIADCGPGEFLTYFHKAEYILTNSYHGVIFSIIFRRPFYAVYQKDSRKDSLLKKLGLEERRICSAEDIQCDMMDKQFDIVTKTLQRERNHSIDFLENSLGSWLEEG